MEKFIFGSFVLIITIWGIFGYSVKIAMLKELEEKIIKLQDESNYYEVHQRLRSLEKNVANFSKIKEDAQEETERINKALYKIQMSIADEDKFNLVRKRYEESLRHKKAMEEINREG